MSSAFLAGVWGHLHEGGLPAAGGGGRSDAKADRASASAQQTEARLERALLTMEAMWTLMSERLGVSDDELQERIVEIDLTDGVLDGRVRRPAEECPACNRRVPRRFQTCMYCGEEILKDPFA